MAEPIPIETESESETESEPESSEPDSDIELVSVTCPTPAPAPAPTKPSVVAAKKGSFSLFKSKRKGMDATTKAPMAPAASREVQVYSEQEETSEKEKSSDDGG
jgi:hypothetical protein